MNTELIQKIEKTILEHNLVGPKQGVVAAVSGGPDSVAMLHILKELSEPLNFWIVSAHLDHGLRPEAKEDALFVQDICERIGIAHYSSSADVRRMAKEKKFSVEQAGRIARYEFLERVRDQAQADLIATAHHRSDKIETFLIRLLKGSSIQGLHGIAIQRGRLIRPMIRTKKEEIIDFLDSQNIDYVTDKTNLLADTDRNFVRNRIIPSMQKGFPGYEGPLERTIDLIERENAFMERLTRQAYKKGSTRVEDHMIQFNLATLRSTDEVILARLLIKGLYDLGGQNLRIGAKHVQSMMSLINRPGRERSLNMPGNIVARVGEIHFELVLDYEKNMESKGAYEIHVKGPGVYKIEQHSVIVEFQFINDKSRIPEQIIAHKNKAYFSPDTVGFPFTIRPRKPGDRIRPWNFNGSKKIKDLMIDARAPVSLRSIWPLITKGDEVLWIPGVRRSNLGPLTKDSDKALLITIDAPFINSETDY